MKLICNTDYMLKCLMKDEEEKVDLSNIDTTEVDIVCIEAEGEINFVHLTYDDCIDSILSEGFRVGDGLLGIGVYVVNPSKQKSLNSLVNFYTDLCEGCDNMVIVQGRYKGKYVESVNAIKEHYRYTEGFVLLEDVSNIEITKHRLVSVPDIKDTLIELGESYIK